MAHERLFGTASPFDGVHEIVLDQSFHAAYHVDIVEPEIGIAHDHAFARKREPYSEVGVVLPTPPFPDVMTIFLAISCPLRTGKSYRTV